MKKTLLSVFIVMTCFVSVNAQLSESFDGATFPPAGWTTNVVSAGDGSGVGSPGDIWSRAATVTEDGEPVINPHSGSGMAQYDAYNFDPSSKADLITPPMDFAGNPKRVTFWMYRSGFYTDPDSLTVFVNTAASITGATLLGRITRYAGSEPVVAAVGWYQYFFDIPASFNGATNYIIFRGNGEYGLSILIDDVLVANQPSCRPVSAITATNFNYAAGTATFTWTPPTGSPTGYQWAVNTTGIAPAAGTAVAGTTAAVTGITSNVVNYVFIRTSCGAGDFSTWDSLAFSAFPCATVTAPVNGSTNIPQTQSFTWNAVTGATSYSFYLGSAVGNEISLGATTELSVTISNLVPLATYYWYVVPGIGNVPGLVNSCTSNSFTIAPEGNTPPNNTCSGAITINGTNITGNAVAATTVGATLSLPAATCAGALGTADDDVWFEFTTSSLPPAGTLTITPNPTRGILDVVAQVYAAASCGNVGAPVYCADLTDSISSEIIALSSLSANTHYYMRVYSFRSTSASRGGFTIVASAGSTLPVSLATFTARHPMGKIS
ncbi:MAG: hypothetical protein WKI04_02035 [Ferruginibacter sp.]